MMQCATKSETLRMDYQNGGSIFDWNLIVCSDHYRSSRSQMFFKIGAFKNFTNFTGKRLCRSLFNRVADLQACSFIQKRLSNTGVFCEICGIFKNIFFYRTPLVAPSIILQKTLWELLNLVGKTFFILHL